MTQNSPYFQGHFFSLQEGNIIASSAPLYDFIPDIVSEFGVRRVISLIKYSNPASKEALKSRWSGAGAIFFNVPLMGGSVPSQDNIEEINNIFNEHAKNDGTLLIHCEEGNGRTGMGLALYLMNQMGKSAKEAFLHIRSLNPKAFDSQAQIDFLEKFVE